ncbi:MAG TPA: hypothetical protein VGL28_10300 [Steroidobacteraceae bacterium]
MDPTAVVNAVSNEGPYAVAVLGVLIPIVAIVMGLGVGMLKLWLDFRKKREILQAHHAERMAAIDKGIELPPLPPEFYSNGGGKRTELLSEKFQGKQIGLHYLRSGLVWLLIGVSIAAALYAESPHDAHDALWGAVPAAYGLAQLLFYVIANRQIERADKPGGQS